MNIKLEVEKIEKLPDKTLNSHNELMGQKKKPDKNCPFFDVNMLI